jgi:hypothetical protein
MSKTVRHFILWLSVLLLSFPLLRVSGWFGLGIPVGLVLSILYGLDLAAECRNAPSSNRLLRIACWALAVPQVLFGLMAAAIGMAILVWVLYNTFVDRQPHYRPHLFAFGVGPALLLFGIGWMASAFRRRSPDSDGA